MTKVSRGLRDMGLGLAVVISRLPAWVPNFSPLGSLGFFNGNPLSFFGSIMVFDLIKGGSYPGVWLTYLGFASYWVFGRLAKTTTQKIVLLPAASLVFFILSNLGVWWYWYPHSSDGLVRCYLFALPFYRNTFMSDLIFGYGYMGLKRYLTRKKYDIMNPYRSLGSYANYIQKDRRRHVSLS